MALALLAQPGLAQDAAPAAQKKADASKASHGADEPRPVVPNAGTIRSFYGPATGSAGTIRSFRGDAEGNAGTIRSFAGTIRSFAGTIRSFESSVQPGQPKSVAFWGDLAPNAGTIRSFGGEFEGHAGTIRSFAGTIRSFEDPSAGYPELMGHLNSLIAASEARYGAAVRERTGQSFDQAVTGKLLGKYGIDLADPATLDLNELGLELFLLDWYDNVNAYSGLDSVDSWMQQVNWSPSLTQALGSGFDSRIGLLDFTVTGEGTGNIVKSGGISDVSGGHGSAVLSLIAGSHDGYGVMGIAPQASVVAYNPFDETRTAGWSDIRTGVEYLTRNGASVVNMSLGVPGYTLASGWNEVFANGAVSKEARKRVFVLSAGNDGVVQTQDVEWDFKKNPQIIIVGSVDPLSNISAFSNQPGIACLVRKGDCGDDADLLMNRFLVAPGELILVSDGLGGVTRMSGTSFAAPLVSGTIALIHDRWPWLAKEPDATVDIVLKSARDLGEAGTDPVYGRGMLDVQAALSPLAWDNLNWKVSIAGRQPVNVNAATVRQGSGWMRSTWDAWGAYVVAFETTGKTYRDFTIPLSSKLVGQRVGEGQDQFMAYLQSRFWDWATPQASIAQAPNGLRFASDVEAPLNTFGEWTATLSVSPRIDERAVGKFRQDMGSKIALQSPGGRFGFMLGQGDGSQAISSQAGFALLSDSALATGGVNPLLSFASGGAFGQFSYAVDDKLALRLALTGRDEERDLDNLAPQDRLSLSRLKPERAAAGVVTLDYRLNQQLSASVSYTLLDEESGLLGMQSLDETDFGSGSRTDALTLGTQYAVTPTLNIAASATLGRTRQGDLSRQNIAVSTGGLLNSAFQVAVTKNELFASTDVARLTIAQPLHVETGSIDINTVEVVDRLTGELGTVVQTVGLDSGPRSFVAEGLYGRTLLDGAASFNLFGRAMLRGQDEASQQPSFTAGASLNLSF
jgi:hypothetical protein